MIAARPESARLGFARLTPSASGAQSGTKRELQLSNLTVALRRPFPSLLLATFVMVTAVVFASACGGGEESPEPSDTSALTPPAIEVGEETTASAGLVPLEIEPAFPGLTFREMVDLTLPEGDDERLYVVLREGVVRAFENSGSVTDSHVFLDIRDLALTRGSEEGLLGLAFAPDYAESGHFYVYYTAPNPRRSVVARYKADLSTSTVPDSTSGETILEAPQPFSNHNGGQIAFGPDGFLYVALGDGGGAGDRLGHGQNPHTLLGTILRLDVSAAVQDSAYGIPSDNPFTDGEEGRPEIFAYGLRNPWRFAFDGETGLLWTADVGQNRYEEIDIVLAGRNYGWNTTEGSTCYPSGGQDCDLAGLEPPVLEYGRSDGCSVTGGRVYRGDRLQSLFGAYVYGDFCSGKIWALKYDDSAVTEHTLLADTDLSISSFGRGPGEELYILDYGERGRIYRLVEP